MIKMPPVQPTRKRAFDFAFALMGLTIIAMALSEYFFPGIGGESRMAVKVLNGFQTVFGLLFGLPCFFKNSETAPGAIGKRVAFAFFMLFFYLCLSGVANSTNFRYTFYLRLMFLYWYSLFFFFYMRAQKYPDKLQVFLILSALSLIIWIPALIHYTKVSYVVGVSTSTFQQQNYVGYYIVALFPFALMIRKNSLKIAAMVLITFGAVYSLKRGAVLALGMMGFASSLLYVVFLSKGVQKIKNIIILICLWGISATGGAIFVVKNQEMVAHRIDSDTGRIAIYASTWSAVKQSDVFHLIIGHGDRQSKVATGHSPHNDWLLLLYDYGLIGVVLMLNVYLWLTVLLLKMIRMKSSLMLPLSSSILLMFCIQFISMGLTLKIFGLITGCVGLVVGCFQSKYETTQNIFSHLGLSPSTAHCRSNPYLNDFNQCVESDRVEAEFREKLLK